MEIKGKVINVKPVETVGANNFKKASIWVETTTDQYPQTIEIEFVKDKVFTSIQGWNVESNF